jgi:hypothetical protein
MTKAIPPTRLRHKALGLVSILAQKIAPEFTAKAEAAEMERLHALAWGDKRQRLLYLASFDKDRRYLHWTGYWMCNGSEMFVPAKLAWLDVSEEDMAAFQLEDVAQEQQAVIAQLTAQFGQEGRP